jgi:hypothetical protein
MTLTFLCPHCRAEVDCDGAAQTSARCGQCGAETPLRPSPALREHHKVDHCVVCGCPSVYVQKDFNRTFGVALFVITAAVSCWLYFYHKVWEAFAVLLGAAALDFVLYRLLPDVIICYRCHSQYRRFAPDSGYAKFDLGLAEKYDPKDKKPGAENPAAEWKQR